MSTERKLKVTIINCQRCGETHKKILFSKLSNPADEYGYYATCPTSRQPILLKTWVECVETPETEESDVNQCHV